MAQKSKIEWTDATWNPVTGCTKVSEGCANCYAESMAQRLQAAGAKRYRNGFKVTCHPEALDEPLHWKKPRRIFVSSMGDLFHEDVPIVFIDKVMQVIYKCRNHTFIILTKRPENIPNWWAWNTWSHLWLGVTVESDKYLWRIEELLKIPAAKRFVSLEPMLGAVDFQEYNQPEVNINYLKGFDGCDPPIPALDWVIIGAESGAKRRECKLEDVRDVVGQCKVAGIPVFVKQLSIGRRVKMFKHNTRYVTKLSKNMDEWPPDLRVRQWPE